MTRTFDIVDWPRRVRFGAGAVAELAGVAHMLGASRAMVLCGRTVAGGEMLARVRDGLGDACAGVFDRIEAQNPLPCVAAAAAKARDLGADCVVSVGGGSAIDAGKCVALILASGGDLAPYQIAYGTRGTMDRKLLGDDVLPHIAVPTTAGSSSEVMPSAGCRDPMAQVKLLFWDQALVPKAVVLDPEMAVFASPELSAHSGFTAIARCVEALYSRDRQPISTGLALEALRLLARALPRAVAEPGDLAARGDCQIGCLMSGTASINALPGVAHAVGHVLGGRFGLQHGIAHSLLLPPAMRLLLPEIGAAQRDVLAALGVGHDTDAAEIADAAAERVAALITAMPLPQSLREAGIAEADLDEIADAAMEDYMLPNTPRPVSRDEVLAILRAAL